MRGLKRIVLCLSMLMLGGVPASTLTAQEFRQRLHYLHLSKQGADTENEIEFGRKVAAKVLGKFPLLKDKKIVDYVTRLGAALAAQLGRPELRFYFGVLDTPDINAYAAPGGYIFITRGALAAMRDEAQLAGALAHEIAHVNLRQIVRKLKLRKQDRSVTTGLAQVLGGASQTARIAFERLNDLAFELLLKEGLSKEDEMEADRNVVEMMAATGYRVGRYLDYLESLRPLLEKGEGKVLSKTHPPLSQRVKQLRVYIKQQGIDPAIGKTNALRFQRNSLLP